MLYHSFISLVEYPEDSGCYSWGWQESSFGNVSTVWIDDVLVGVHFFDTENECRSCLSRFKIEDKADTRNKETLKLIHAFSDKISWENYCSSIKVGLCGTDFQIKTWQAIAEISWGETCSYGEVSNKVSGKPAARAVGQACSSNLLALIIPCHRVVSASLSKFNYRWKPWRKKLLLEHERRNRAKV
ncbi:MAG: methylated-DNA--[protein]-cysteine S-methyltransferase [Methylacidiphilales bacterium]|nr:methylated-DNA--[protein]-cysteine S-methyltransferase [Candidatus Methylacidiphilales bacterium]MDW8348686.1 methylated-DNA--[protein]-cysteine S-methyltransferase [Verrucomicrobiae bacterium]